MGRIFISAGQGSYNAVSLGVGTTQAQEMILLRDYIVPELRSRGFEVLSVPDELSVEQTLNWINSRAREGDVALEIHADACFNSNLRGACVFYIASNTERKNHAELLLLALLRRLPQLPHRGAKPDTASGIGRLVFCRDIAIPSILMEVGFLGHPEDRFLIQNRRRDIALGIVDGLVTWSRNASSETSDRLDLPYPAIGIDLNHQTYIEKGILIHHNPYIPIDLVDRLGIDVSACPSIRRLQYRGIVYIKAIELREFNLSIRWDSNSRTLSLRSILQISPERLDRIMSSGYTSEVQLIVFLKAHNENALAQFPDLAKLYREEASLEGVNYDIAFCQMCLETHFLQFGGDIKPNQNNFANLGAIGTGIESASFNSIRLGIRAHIQHLKAYASLEPLVQELVDPRFHPVTRGIAPVLDRLNGRWSADCHYGAKIKSILRRLYESADLL